MRAAPSCVFFFAALLAAPAARADLRSDAARIVDLWTTSGQEIERSTIFLEQGRQRWRKPGGPPRDCLSVALLAPRAAELSLILSSDEAPEPSLAGLAFLTRCGPARAALERFAVEMRGNRSAIEVLSARGAAPAPDPRVVLPERIASPPTPPLDPGRAPASESMAARVARAEGRAHAEGAAQVQVIDAPPQEDGRGRLLLAFREGCHRLDVLADAGRGGRVADLDAELRDPRTDALLVRDRSDTADARLELCTAEPAALALSFRGAPARARVALLQARWPLPPALPAIWGTRARASMAFALSRRGLSPPTTAPIRAFTGLSGSTSLSPELAPGACYLLLLGVARGDARALILSASLEGHFLRDEGGQGRDGLALAFCSERSERLHFTAEIRGSNLAWGAALWRVGGPP